jgi:hypothetical protein
MGKMVDKKLIPEILKILINACLKRYCDNVKDQG